MSPSIYDMWKKIGTLNKETAISITKLKNINLSSQYSEIFKETHILVQSMNQLADDNIYGDIMCILDINWWQFIPDMSILTYQLSIYSIQLLIQIRDSGNDSNSIVTMLYNVNTYLKNMVTYLRKMLMEIYPTNTKTDIYIILGNTIYTLYIIFQTQVDAINNTIRDTPGYASGHCFPYNHYTSIHEIRIIFMLRLYNTINNHPSSGFRHIISNTILSFMSYHTDQENVSEDIRNKIHEIILEHRNPI